MSAPPQIFPAQKACSKCATLLPATPQNFPADGRRADGLRKDCRACGREKAKAWAAANRERSRNNCAKYRLFHGYLVPRPKAYVVHDRDTEIAKVKARLKARPEVRIAKRLRDRIARHLGAEHGSRSALLGCTPLQLRAHLESQFTEGMNWNNRELWHVDHIRPLASFDLTNFAERAVAARYTNLQPLWAADNLRKGAKVLP